MVYKTILDWSGNSVKATEFIDEDGNAIGPIEAKTEIAALAALTDNGGGAAADGTIAAIPAATAAVTDTTAASLTSTNASITALNAAVKELSTKANLIIAALKA